MLLIKKILFYTYVIFFFLILLKAMDSFLGYVLEEKIHMEKNERSVLLKEFKPNIDVNLAADNEFIRLNPNQKKNDIKEKEALFFNLAKLFPN